MIHPETELRLIGPQVGYGVVATRFIPRGTLVYVQDPLDIIIPSHQYRNLDPVSQEVAEKYSYIDSSGSRILSWDMAKYVNHSCAPNTVSTAWSFEIAIRDIQPGEEITDDYGLFNLEWEMACACAHRRCRGVIRSQEPDAYYRRLDRAIRVALGELRGVDQPLWHLVDPDSRRSLDEYLDRRSRYRSVRNLLTKSIGFPVPAGNGRRSVSKDRAAALRG